MQKGLVYCYPFMILPQLTRVPPLRIFFFSFILCFMSADDFYRVNEVLQAMNIKHVEYANDKKVFEIPCSIC